GEDQAVDAHLLVALGRGPDLARAGGGGEDQVDLDVRNRVQELALGGDGGSVGAAGGVDEDQVGFAGARDGVGEARGIARNVGRGAHDLSVSAEVLGGSYPIGVDGHQGDLEP